MDEKRAARRCLSYWLILLAARKVLITISKLFPRCILLKVPHSAPIAEGFPLEFSCEPA